MGRTVDTYDIELRHGGNIFHSTPKKGVTMKEIVLLRSIHGDDAVPDSLVKKAGTKEAQDEKLELFDLARRYANTADPMSGKKIVEKTFSTALIGFEAWLQETIELEQMEREERREQHQTDTAKLMREREAQRAEEEAARKRQAVAA